MKKNAVWFGVGILVMGLTAFAVERSIANYVAEQSATTVLNIEVQVAEQELLLIKIADLARQNGADAITERIIVDCTGTERQRFETLLDQLSGSMSPSQLSELDGLFYKCGSFFADRKSVMATRLLREVAVYSDYVALLGTLREIPQAQNSRVSAWSQLAEAELKAAEYFNQLVTLQGTIITELRAGALPDSDSVTSTLAEVTTIRGQMVVLSQQIENYRTAAVQL